MRRLLLAVAVGVALVAAPPAPEQHFGYKPGDDYKLANYDELIGYFRKLADSSGRLRLEEFGKTAAGKPMYVAYISSEENIKRLDEYRAISRELALGRPAPEQARRMAAEGKAIVWIDSGLHATEVAPVQHAPLLAWRMVSGEDDETRRIRDRVILMQIPCINPDGLDMVAGWYRKNLSTPHELAPLPWLYQKYSGHDNNRDWFMLNLVETRNVTRLMFQEWFPQIVYNQHQMPPFPARIFVPPYAEPLNPHIPASVMEGINLIGSAMKERFAREDKPGVISYHGFDGWWNGGLRSVPAFHNMHGILTETAGYHYATPHLYKPNEMPERFSNGIPTREPSIFYQRPWLGGAWRLRDAVDYMLTADLAILDLASARSEHFLGKAYALAREAIEKGRKGQPYAYVIAPDQWDAPAAIDMLRRLSLAGVEVHRADAAFRAGNREYPAGTYVLQAAQPFRAYLVDLMEPQRYPVLRAGTTGPTKRPYDIAGWTLPMQMGVRMDRIDEPFSATLKTVSTFETPSDSLDSRHSASFVALAERLANGSRVRRSQDGRWVDASAADFERAAWEMKPPRVALYGPSLPNMDAGWTEYMLDSYKIPRTLLRNEEVRAGKLRSRFDVLILTSQSASSILHGTRDGERSTSGSRFTAPDPARAQQRPEFTGGIGLSGLQQMEQFVREGGTLIALDAATELPLQHFGLPVRALLRYRQDSESRDDEPTTGYYCPGSLLRIDVDSSHPLAFGMPQQAIAMSTGGQAFEITLLPEHNNGEREVRSVARYATKDLLASGWISGEAAVLGRPILLDARHGAGRVVLFGFRPQFRGQPHGTFKLLLNAIYMASAQRREAAAAESSR